MYTYTNTYAHTKIYIYKHKYIYVHILKTGGFFFLLTPTNLAETFLSYFSFFSIREWLSSFMASLNTFSSQKSCSHLRLSAGQPLGLLCSNLLLLGISYSLLFLSFIVIVEEVSPTVFSNRSLQKT